MEGTPKLPETEQHAEYERRIEALQESYALKVDDLRRETLRTSAALQACAERGIKSPRHIVGEAGYGWDAAMEYVERRIKEAT